jgi:hypothetical protein
MTVGRLASPAKMALAAAVIFGFSTSAFATTFSYAYVGKNYDFNKPAPYNDTMTVTARLQSTLRQFPTSRSATIRRMS